jgi:hypothetical protein
VGNIRCEQSNNSLYTFEGTLDLRMPGGVPKQVSKVGLTEASAIAKLRYPWGQF